MRVCADENVAPRLTVLIREQLLSPDFSLDTVDDHSARGLEDEIWVRRFAEAGGEAVIGGDFRLTKKPHEVVAINETGLRVIVLDERWSRQPKHIQISYLFYWWPHIEAVLRTAGKGKCFKVPWGWGDPADAIRPISLDLQRAYKAVKKARAFLSHRRL